MKADATLSPMHAHTRLWEDSESMIPYIQRACVTHSHSNVPLLTHTAFLCLSPWLPWMQKHTEWRARTHTHTWVPVVSFGESTLSEGTVWAFVKKELQRQRNLFPTVPKKMLSLFRKVTLYLKCFKNGIMLVELHYVAFLLGHSGLDFKAASRVADVLHGAPQVWLEIHKMLHSRCYKS